VIWCDPLPLTREEKSDQPRVDQAQDRVVLDQEEDEQETEDEEDPAGGEQVHPLPFRATLISEKITQESPLTSDVEFCLE